MRFALYALCLVFVISASSAYALPKLSNMYNPGGLNDIVHTSFLKKFFGGNDEQVQQQPQNPTAAIMSDEEFKTKSTEYIQKKFEYSPIKYSLSVPNEWEDILGHDNSVPNLDTRLLKDLSIFRGPLVVGGDRPRLSVSAILMEHDILAEHWLRYYVFNNGYTVDGEITSNAEKEASATLVSIINGLSYRSFMRVIIVENRLLAVLFEAPIKTPSDLTMLGYKSAMSFKVVESNVGSIEEMTGFSLANKLDFSYPSSWIVKNHNLSQTDKISAELHNIGNNDELVGLIHMQSFRINQGQDLRSIINQLKEHTTSERKIKFHDLTHSAPFNAGLEFDAAHIEKYTVSLQNKTNPNYEVWLVVMNVDNWVHTAYLLTPSEKQDFYRWARNTRTLDIILNSMN